MEEGGIETWVVRMSSQALAVGLELEADCKQTSRNSYDEAQILLEKAKTAEEIELAKQVWEYVQVKLYAGWNDRVLIDIIP